MGSSSYQRPGIRRLPDYYEVLGVRRDATFREIEAAYWRVANQRHDLLALVNEAYEVLGTPTRREAYNADRAAEAPAKADRVSESRPPSPPSSRLRDKLQWHQR